MFNTCANWNTFVKVAFMFHFSTMLTFLILESLFLNCDYLSDLYVASKLPNKDC